MKRNVIVFIATAAVLVAASLLVGAATDPPPVVLGPQPVRVVEGQTYVVNLPPKETGIQATLVLSNESGDWDAPVNIADAKVSVPPGVAYSFIYLGEPVVETSVVVTRGSFPWSGGEEGYVWASVYYTQTKAVVQYNSLAQHVTRRVMPR